jgi:hypothetical protein
MPSQAIDSSTRPIHAPGQDRERRHDERAMPRRAEPPPLLWLSAAICAAMTSTGQRQRKLQRAAGKAMCRVRRVEFEPGAGRTVGVLECSLMYSRSRLVDRQTQLVSATMPPRRGRVYCDGCRAADSWRARARTRRRPRRGSSPPLVAPESPRPSGAPVASVASRAQTP